jgi:hypothetical protein
MGLVTAIKRRLHRDIVSDPVLHGRVLNLYLNGEEYPHRVEDYFPLAAVEDRELAATMRRHLREEDKHVALYRKAIARIGQPIRAMPTAEIYNSVIRRHTPADFAMTCGDGPDARRLKLAHFLAHLHFLEARIARSLEIHLEACAHAPTPYPGKAIAAVLRDEYGHVAYTREAVRAILPRGAAGRVMALHRDAESRANREFSSTQLERLVREHRGRFGPWTRALYLGCAAVTRRPLHG